MDGKVSILRLFMKGIVAHLRCMFYMVAVHLL